MKKIFSLLLAVVMFVTLFTGCSDQGKEGEQLEISVTTTFAGEDGNAKNYKTAIEGFTGKTGIKINDSSANADENFKARIQTDFQAGSEPDVLFFFTGADASAFIEQDKVVPIDEIRSVYPDFATNMKEDWLPTNLVNEKNYAVPVNGFWEAMFCNTEVLDAAGVQVPGADYTWGQFKVDCQKIKNAGYIPIAAALGHIPHYWWELSIFNHTTPGTHTEVPSDTRSGNGPAWVQGMEDIKELYELGYFPENTNYATDDETFSLFTESKAAFLVDGSWKVGGIVSACQTDPEKADTLDTEKLDKFDVTFVPTKGKRKTTDLIGGLSMGYYITRKAWNDPAKRDASVKFVEYMTSDEMVPVFSAHTPTALKKDPEIDEKNLNSLQIKALNMLKEVTSLTGAVQDVFDGECRTSTFDGMPQIVTGGVSAESAVAEGLAVYAAMNQK